MVTGDDKAIATETARMLGMNPAIKGPEGLPVPFASSVFCSNFCMPFHKARRSYVFLDCRT
jgi:hypothetical protein